VYWIKDGTKVNGTVYVIDNVQPEDSGRYTCVVELGGGHFEEAEAVVRVQCKLFQVCTKLISFCFGSEDQPTIALYVLRKLVYMGWGVVRVCEPSILENAKPAKENSKVVCVEL
jgi:hypothetical protein